MHYFVLLFLAACVTTESVDVSLSLPESAPSPLSVRLRVGASDEACPSVPDDAATFSFQEGDSPDLGSLDEGPTLFVADAWNADCTACFSGCVSVDVGSEQVARIALDPSSCDASLCMAMDGGVDSGDAGTDADDGSVELGPRDEGVDADGGDGDVDQGRDGGLPVGPVAIAAGTQHTCIIDEDARVLCWGRNHNGQAGSGSADVRTPVPLLTTREATMIAAGDTHSCAVLTGEVFCWGSDAPDEFRLGRASGDVLRLQGPAPVEFSDPAPMSPIESLSVGLWHSCVAYRDGNAFCWGQNESAELGTCGGEVLMQATAVVGIAGVEVAAGSGPSCLRSADGQLYCWGFNSYELGTSTANCEAPPLGTPPGLVQFEGSALQNVVAVEVGGYREGFGGQICALRDDELICWGRNDDGQGGSGTISRTQLPFPVAGLGPVIDFSLGGYHSCAIDADHRVYCWGRNAQGQLGDGSNTPRSAPGTPIPDLRARLIAAGGEHTCAVALDGEVWCWGDGENGRLGNGFDDDQTRPVRVNLP